MVVVGDVVIEQRWEEAFSDCVPNGEEGVAGIGAYPLEVLPFQLERFLQPAIYYILTADISLRFGHIL